MISNAILRDRAHMLAAVRTFFAERGVLEVDTPSLSPTAPISTHIDVMQTEVSPGQIGYLHTSPEYAMKRLLSHDSGDIYQLSHVFRANEAGRLHNPEFTMIEWYRTQLPFKDFIEETLDLIRLFLGPLFAETLTYRGAIERYSGPSAYESPLESLGRHGHELSSEVHKLDHDSLLSLLFSHVVEPHLGKDKLTVIVDYPASQAALAKTHLSGKEMVASRFEFYYHGIELANGYDELTDATEQRARLEADNLLRQKMGKPSLPIDEEFIKALERGLPDCRGVAVGFDRLMLLRHKSTSLAQVTPFTWI